MGERLRLAGIESTAQRKRTDAQHNLPRTRVPHSSDRDIPTSPAAVSATEWAWLAAAVVAGAVLRLAFPGRMAVEHFDEGVYASNVLFGAESSFQYPGREFFAPPLLPTVIEWLHIGWSLTGLTPPGWLPMVPALVCGMATIPSLWWIARRWFSPHAGVAAAWLIALCEFHAFYSRTALTDVPLTFCLMWAVYWFGRALAFPPGSPGTAVPGSLRATAFAGALTAAAWWTKYNGWLPIAIAATAVALCLLITRAPRQAWAGTVVVGTLATLIAVALWLPVLWDCQDVGGYRAIAANHRGYVDGWGAWLTNAVQQFEIHGGAYAGWATLVGIAAPTLIAVLLGWCHGHGVFDVAVRSGREHGHAADGVTVAPTTTDWHRLAGLVINATIVAFRPGSWLPIAFGTAAVCSLLALRRAARERTFDLAWSASLVLVWVMSLVVVTPLYRAYPRLLIPLIVGSLLGASLFWRRGWVDFIAPALRRTWWLGPAIALSLALGVLAVRGSTAWEDRSGYRAASRALSDRSTYGWDDRAGGALVYVISEPGFFYNLRTAGVPAATVGDFRFLDHPVPDAQVFVAAGPLIGGAPGGSAAWDAVRDQFALMGEVEGPPLSSLVRFDQSQDRAQQSAVDRGSERYALYRWTGPAEH
jgi:4-amino-4-deoxy-L-arabinose transferase-like glycosyltransferase